MRESCDEDLPHLITDVQTTPAPRSDCDMTPQLQASLASRHILPRDQLLDRGEVTAEHLVSSQSQYEVDLVGPVAPDPSWQAQSTTGFGTADFPIDWQEKRARCFDAHHGLKCRGLRGLKPFSVNLARNRRVFLGKGRREKKKQRIGKDGSLLGGSLPIGHFVLSAGYLAPAHARSVLESCTRTPAHYAHVNAADLWPLEAFVPV
jgi:hypothetical protein